MRRTFSASSFDSNLPLRFEGEVHSIFSKALNIRTEEDELISIVAAEKLNGPHRILLRLSEDEDFVTLEIREGMRVKGSRQEVKINRGRLSVSLEKAERWSPEIKRGGSTPYSQIKDNLLSLKRRLLIERDGDIISQALRTRTQELITSVKEKDLPKVSENVRRLIGFGEGLTPSGDDFLVGFVASLHFLDNSIFKYFSREIRRSINLKKKRTTFLSEKFLEYACQGKFSETILNLIKTIFSEDREEVEEATKRCLNFGASSGRDTILGVLEGLSLNVNEIENDSKKYC